MKIDFSQTLKTLKGEPMKIGQEAATLREVAIEALLSPVASDGGETGAAKLKRYQLAQRISEAKGPVEVEHDDVTLLREAIAAAFDMPAVSGQAWQMIDKG